MNILREDYLMSIAKLLYPEWVGLRGLDSHRAFIVKYTIGEDVELSYHYDNAEVTLNVCLGKKFKGGDLYFGPMRMVSTTFISCSWCSECHHLCKVNTTEH